MTIHDVSSRNVISRNTMLLDDFEDQAVGTNRLDNLVGRLPVTRGSREAAVLHGINRLGRADKFVLFQYTDGQWDFCEPNSPTHRAILSVGRVFSRPVAHHQHYRPRIADVP